MGRQCGLVESSLKHSCLTKVRKVAPLRSLSRAVGKVGVKVYFPYSRAGKSLN